MKHTKTIAIQCLYGDRPVKADASASLPAATDTATVST